MKKQLQLSATIICLLLISSIIHAQGLITTISGTGTGGYNGDSILAANAQIYTPSQVYIGLNSEVFIADGNNNRIRKINSATGIITTIAGTGVQGFSGDSSLAINAQLSFPRSVSFDTSGNMYITDAGNNRIRRIDAITGIITTIAGNGTQGGGGDNGIALDAQFNSPSAAFVDHSGNIYVTDENNHRIRKINSSTNIITTIAGNGVGGYSGDNMLATNSSLHFPHSVFVTPSGDVFIADVENQRIRKVAASTGLITTVVGNGVAGYAGDNIPAISTKLNYPFGVFVDAINNIYIADAVNNRIRKVNAMTGIITTIAGNGIAGFSGDNILSTNTQLNNPLGVFVDSTGNVYIADAFNNRIRKIMTGTSVTDPTAGGRVQVYPNPCNGVFTVGVGVHSGAADICINNMLGQQVYAATVSGAEHTVNIASQPDGVYMLYVKTADNVTTQRVIVTK